MKVLHAGWAGDDVVIARFEREARVVRGLSHPNVCEVFEHGRLDDGRPYIAMELLSGSTLAAHLTSRGRLSQAEALSILRPLAAALGAAHARGIVHRDLKPSNVMLAGDRVVLLDFGVAKLRDAGGVALTGARDTLGTLLFMAPEQLLGGELDARADVYALGALAYVMLTGRPPFRGSTIRELRQLHRTSRPPAPSAEAPVTPALDAPLLRALERHPEARWASASDLVAALEGALAARGAPERPLGGAGRAALAVHAEVRLLSASMEDEGGEPWLAALESALPAVSKELCRGGFFPVVETATRLLLVDVESPDAMAVEAALDAASRAYGTFVDSLPPGAPVALAIAAHAGEVFISAEGALLDGGLLDVASWLPAAPAGVIASAAISGRIERPRALVDQPDERPRALVDQPDERPRALVDQPGERPRALVDQPDERPRALVDGAPGFTWIRR